MINKLKVFLFLNIESQKEDQMNKESTTKSENKRIHDTSTDMDYNIF